MVMVLPDQPKSVVEAAEFGVPGDGLTDARPRLQALLDRGFSVALAAGATYLLKAALLMQPGQTLYGNGARLLRAPQAQTSIRNPTVAGVTLTLYVADASAFREGMSVTLADGALYSHTEHFITRIQGNEITVGTNWDVSFPAGARLYQQGYLLVAAEDGRVYDLELDGNRSAWSFARWEGTADLHWTGPRCLFAGLYVHDSPGEGIEGGVNGDDTAFQSCHVTNVNGNGLHLSTQSRCQVIGCRFINCNLDPSVGHADGCIIWSNLVSDVTVSGCYLQNGISGIGSIDYSGNSDVTIQGCTIRDMTGTAFDAICGSDPGTLRVLIQGNRFYDCAPALIFTALAVGASSPSEFLVENNLFVNTRLLVQRATHITVRGNGFYSPADTANYLLQAKDCQHVLLEGNDLIGGNRGIYVDGANTHSVRVIGNQCRNQNLNGIWYEIASAPNGAVIDNSVTNDSTAQNSYDGIVARNAIQVRGNLVTVVKGHAGIYPQEGCLVKDNTVRNNGATYSIRADAGTTTILLKDNETSTAISNAGTNVVSGNEAIT